MQKLTIAMLFFLITLPAIGQTQINLTLKKELDSILVEDQHLRDLISSELLQTKNDSLAQVFKIEKNQLIPYIIRQIPIIDSQNMARVEQIINQYGYPGLRLVGPITNEAAYYVIQHSTKIDTYLQLIENAANKKEIAYSLYAMMLDRSLMYKGEEQIYGTQGKGLQVLNKATGAKEFTTVIWPIKDVANVNKRRKEAGFKSTVEEYAKQSLGIDYTIFTLEDIKKMQRE